MDVRPEIRADERSISELVSLAFGADSAETALVPRLRDDAGFLPDLSLVAVRAGSVLGFAVFTLVELVGDGDGPVLPVLALAVLAVHPAHQRQGVGRGLVDAGLRRCARRAEPFVAVVGEPAYFSGLGFVPAADMGVRAPFAVEDGWLQVRRLPAFRSAGAGVLCYPAAFGGDDDSDSG